MSTNFAPVNPEDLDLTPEEMELFSRGAAHLFGDKSEPDEEEPTDLKGALEDFALESREKAGASKDPRKGTSLQD